MSDELVVLHEGKYLRFVRRGTWEFVERRRTSGVVAIVPVTDADEIVLTEQFRPAVNRTVIEFPAGLAGDEAGAEAESLEEAARRELLEEIGCEAERWTCLATCPTSSGLTNEMVTFFRADGLRQVAKGGGTGDERIVVHRVAIADLDGWLERAMQQGALLTALVPAGLQLAGIAPRRTLRG